MFAASILAANPGLRLLILFRIQLKVSLVLEKC